MKHFKIITIISLTIISILVIGNIFYLHGLYTSIKQQTIQTVNDCVRRADLLEMVHRLKYVHNVDDSFLQVVLRIDGKPTSNGIYSYPDITDQLIETLTASMHSGFDEDDMHIKMNSAVLDSLFMEELHRAELYPSEAYILPADSTHESKSGMWVTEFKINDNTPIYTAYFSSLGGYVLWQMAGIIVTSVLILLITGFLILYLLYIVSRLRTIEEMKDDFTHNMTHELKTPVAVAFSAADSMLRYYDQSDAERNKQFLNIIMQRLTHLSGMIENILSMSMERFKGMKLNHMKVSVKPIIEEIAGMIKLKAEKPVEIHISASNDDITVNTDPLHFGNIISNILDNAIKYSGDSVIISISLTPEQISISDNGYGIQDKSLPYIFDKFYRVTDGDRYDVGGYGLGLFYVKQIVTMMGWDISVKSMVGKGTTFTIKFEKQ